MISKELLKQILEEYQGRHGSTIDVDRLSHYLLWHLLDHQLQESKKPTDQTRLWAAMEAIGEYLKADGDRELGVQRMEFGGVQAVLYGKDGREFSGTAISASHQLQDALSSLALTLARSLRA